MSKKYSNYYKGFANSGSHFATHKTKVVSVLLAVGVKTEAFKVR